MGDYITTYKIPVAFASSIGAVITIFFFLPARKPTGKPMKDQVKDTTDDRKTVRVTYDDGSTYDGSWSGSNCHGLGTMNYKNGDTYIGNWVDGKKHGQGKYTWACGDVYEGNYKADERHGKGKLTTFDGQVSDGMWRDGIFSDPAAPKSKGVASLSTGTASKPTALCRNNKVGQCAKGSACKYTHVPCTRPDFKNLGRQSDCLVGHPPIAHHASNPLSTARVQFDWRTLFELLQPENVKNVNNIKSNCGVTIYETVKRRSGINTVDDMKYAKLKTLRELADLLKEAQRNKFLRAINPIIMHEQQSQELCSSTGDKPPYDEQLSLAFNLLRPENVADNVSKFYATWQRSGVTNFNLLEHAEPETLIELADLLTEAQRNRFLHAINPIVMKVYNQQFFAPMYTRFSLSDKPPSFLYASLLIVRDLILILVTVFAIFWAVGALILWVVPIVTLNTMSYVVLFIVTMFIIRGLYDERRWASYAHPKMLKAD